MDYDIISIIYWRELGVNMIKQNLKLGLLFRFLAQRIKIYVAIESEIDPIEHTKELQELPSIPIDAIVDDLKFESIQWVMTGIATNHAKQLYIEKRNRNLVENSYRININDEDFEGYRINGKMVVKEEGDYIRVYVYHKMVGKDL